MISGWVHKASNTLCVEPAQIFKGKENGAAMMTYGVLEIEN